MCVGPTGHPRRRLETAGQITADPVKSNALVKAGDVLLASEPARFRNWSIVGGAGAREVDILKENYLQETDIAAPWPELQI